MDHIPRAVLSEHFQDRMKGRRLVSAVFTTFRFEPGFFESEVLPVFIDDPVSHAGPIRLVQLEEALRSRNIAVYYDQHGLVAEGGSAKLDVRRIPIKHPTGIFHPKNVLVLVEENEPNDDGHKVRALLCACLSANLTRAGWWENVEVAHVEEIGEGEANNLRDALIAYADRLVARSERRRANDELRQAHTALRDIREFLRDTKPRDHRSVDGRLRTHFHNGGESLPDFIQNTAGAAVQGMCLEVISPYFDGGSESVPLAALLERFVPRETRVFLPKNDRGEAVCPEDLFSWVRTRYGVSWGTLPPGLLRLGKAEETKLRTVHAKVYRFFEPTRGGRQILYVGSTNLTQAGCRVTLREGEWEGHQGGNWETGFLVEATSSERPDWWLVTETRRPTSFAPRGEDEGTASSGGSALAVRYRWDRGETTVFWGGEAQSPALSVEHGGVPVFAVTGLPPCEWVELARADSERLCQTLRSTSLLQVVGEGPEPGLLLVQEEGMSHRPSLLLELSAADILRYWALLSVEQRAAFIEARARIAGDDDPLVAKLAPLPVETTLFDRFAGVFHAFGCLEERVREALDALKTREADYRLFGKKYDSLGSLLDRVLSDVRSAAGDPVEQYVVVLCTRQLLRELARSYPEYWQEHRDDVKGLEAQLADAASARAALAAGHAEMPEFLDWFDRWFLKRAEALPEEGAS
jgi:hypothetical protein